MSIQMVKFLDEIVQGSDEWHQLRKNKITATDACIIMGSSHWKTRIQLYNEKISEEINTFSNQRMQRGIELEPIARALFEIQSGFTVYPKVIVKDWAMSSVDGISLCGKYLVEIKCPGEKDHAIALSGKVPDHYYPQLQHQMWVCDLEIMFYYSFDGNDGVIVEVLRDQEYIDKMIEEEYKFYQCLINRIPPEPLQDEYIERDDELWNTYASQWKLVMKEIKGLEIQEKELRNELIYLSGESNTKGAGISLCQVQRKGNLDYSKIPELKNLDLEKYRKPSISSWRITS